MDLTMIKRGLFLLVFVIGCDPGTKIHACDVSLNRCVQALGEKLKEKCYETYNVCITKGMK